jgi:putative NIF3 family GTP cyclohydrolase 1 type 2
MSMFTDDLVALALDMAGLTDLPADSEVIVPGGPVTRVAVGIELGLAELMLAKHLGYHGAITHHPRGARSVMNYADVLLRHAVLMKRAGVPAATADRLAQEFAARNRLEKHAAIYDSLSTPAALVGLPFVGLHTPLDEIGRRRMQERVDEVCAAKPDATVRDLVDGLYGFGEFRNALTRIEVRHGSLDAPAGRAFVCHGAGTNGGFPIAKAYFDAGVQTLIYIHVAAADLARIRAETGLNLIVTGHIASDSLGINPFLAALRERGLTVTNVGGIVPP